MSSSISRRRFLQAAGIVSTGYFILPSHVMRANEKVNMRPAYHITSARQIGWPFDPNGAIYWRGRYHLMWIAKRDGWAHASSADLIHWEMHPKQRLFYFSGKAFVNKDGDATVVYGGGADGVAIAAAVASDDKLDEWKLVSSKRGPEEGDPDPNMFDLWDPCGWQDGENYYAIFGTHPHRSKPATVWKSSGLKKWNYVGPLLSREMPGVDSWEDISCPDIFKLGDKHMLLCIAHIKGARYYIGELKDGQFHPESHGRMNWPGGACFAPETLVDDKGRRIMWAWAMDDHRYRKQQTATGWAGTMTMPRELSLADDGTLVIKPVNEYESLRCNERKLEKVTVAAGSDKVLEKVSGDCLELMVDIRPGSDKPCGVKVRRSCDGEEETVISYDHGKKHLRIDVAKSSLDKGIVYHTFVQNYDGKNNTPKASENLLVTAQEAPFELKAGEPLRLRIFVDRTILEVFANDRQCMTQRIYPTRPDSVGVSLFSRDGKAAFTSVRAWDMAPIKVQAAAKGK
jgi:sucrose-6-phosphate hydrolase SacC (GH32 family)